MFSASFTVELGNGANTLFWSDHWLGGRSIPSLFPRLARGVPTRLRKTRSVAQALHNNCWISDIREPDPHCVGKILRLGGSLQTINLHMEHHDRAIWRWEASCHYSSKSAQKVFFLRLGRVFEHGGYLACASPFEMQNFCVACNPSPLLDGGSPLASWSSKSR